MTAPQPVVRMDRSRDFSTVHGERVPGDRHAKVFFYQDGLPYGSDGKLLFNHPDITDDEEKQAKAERLMAQAVKLAESAPGDAAADGDEEGGEDLKAPVNLEMWARGEQRVQWQEVTNAIARRFAKRVTNKTDALELLVAEKVVALAHLSKDHKKLLDLE